MSVGVGPVRFDRFMHLQDLYSVGYLGLKFSRATLVSSGKSLRRLSSMVLAMCCLNWASLMAGLRVRGDKRFLIHLRFSRPLPNDELYRYNNLGRGDIAIDD